MMESTKFQAPNNKQAPMNEIPNSKRNSFGSFEIGNYLACLRVAASAKAGIWNLRFGIF
jgi:hypothetical protein